MFYYFTLWRQDGLDQRIQEILRCQVRERAGRLEDPSLVIIDTQSVRVAAGVPKETTGLDANKKTPGRKRSLAFDVLGLIIGAVVLAASVHDNEAGIALLEQAAERYGMRLEKVPVDRGFKNAVIIHGAVKDATVEVVRRNPDDAGKGFVPQPKRWVGVADCVGDEFGDDEEQVLLLVGVVWAHAFEEGAGGGADRRDCLGGGAERGLPVLGAHRLGAAGARHRALLGCRGRSGCAGGAGGCRGGGGGHGGRPASVLVSRVRARVSRKLVQG